MNKEPIEDYIKYVEENAKRVNEFVRKLIGGKKKMTKVNQQTMKTQYDGQYDTFCRKNHDYGNSFEESLDQFGIVASIVRMSDKMKRLESLTDESKTQQVGSESLLDTLEDLSNYAAMTACWLRGIREEEPKNIYEELEELFVKQNEHIKVLLTSGAAKDDIKPLAILDYKNKTSESVNGYDLLLALDCIIPNLTKEGLEHFIQFASDALAKKE